MDIAEAKKTLKTMKENIDKKYLKSRNSEAIETVLSELEKKDKEYEELTEASKELCKTVNLMKKVINEMAKQLAKLREERRGRLFYKPTYKCMRNKI